MFKITHHAHLCFSRFVFKLGKEARLYKNVFTKKLVPISYHHLKNTQIMFQNLMILYHSFKSLSELCIPKNSIRNSLFIMLMCKSNIVIMKVFSAKHSFDGFHYINVQKNHGNRMVCAHFLPSSS